MKRTLSLIRWLLEHVEQKTATTYSDVPSCKKYGTEQVHYHVGLCLQAGYLDARPISGAEESFVRYEIGSLTWTGHNALESIRKTGEL